MLISPELRVATSHAGRRGGHRSLKSRLRYRWGPINVLMPRTAATSRYIVNTHKATAPTLPIPHDQLLRCLLGNNQLDVLQEEEQIRFSQRWLRKVISPGMWRRLVRQKFTDVSGKHTASIFRIRAYAVEASSEGQVEAIVKRNDLFSFGIYFEPEDGSIILVRKVG